MGVSGVTLNVALLTLGVGGWQPEEAAQQLDLLLAQASGSLGARQLARQERDVVAGHLAGDLVHVPADSLHLTEQPAKARGVTSGARVERLEVSEEGRVVEHLPRV